MYDMCMSLERLRSYGRGRAKMCRIFSEKKMVLRFLGLWVQTNACRRLTANRIGPIFGMCIEEITAITLIFELIRYVL